DGDAEAVADQAQVLDRRIDAAARLRHALDLMDRRRAFEILELDLEFLAALVLGLAEIADIALVLQHIENARAQRRVRRRELGAPAQLRVADAGDEIADGIVQVHVRPLTSST